MNKKIIASLATIAVVGAAAIGGTIAYFSDQQVSTGNIIQAGTIDLEINHSAQTYNGVDCKACVQEVVSGTDDKIVAWRFAGSWVGFGTPWNAVEVAKNSAWNTLHDSSNNVIPWIWGDSHADGFEGYRFEKTFSWAGPTTTASVTLDLLADNTYKVKLDGTQICADMSNNSSNYTNIQTCDLGNITTGEHTLTIEVTNKASWWGENNPAGLTYKLTIDGNCNDPDSYFGGHCALWQTGNFTNQKFFDFDDVKPGDWGTNKISLTVTSNDANVCMYVIPTTTNAADIALASYIKFNLKYDGSSVTEGQNISLSNLVQLLGALPTNTTKYVDVEWCFGNFDGQGNCDGTGNQNNAQGGRILADLGFYAEQTRHNGSFACPANPFAVQ